MWNRTPNSSNAGAEPRVWLLCGIRPDPLSRLPAKTPCGVCLRQKHVVQACGTPGDGHGVPVAGTPPGPASKPQGSTEFSPRPFLAHPEPRYPVQNAWWHRRDASQRGTIAAAEAVA